MLTETRGQTEPTNMFHDPSDPGFSSLNPYIFAQSLTFHIYLCQEMTETLWNRKRELCEEILETLKVTSFI